MVSAKQAALAATGIGIAGLLGACSSDSKSSDSTTTTTQAKTSSSSGTATSSTGAGGAATLPAAPSGSVELQNTTTNGVVYQRWSNSSATPQQVVTSYQNALTAQGFTITNSGGGGGGWGKWGGANAGVSANKGGTYVDVQAGGQSGQTTYFEVCQGPSQQSVNQCENASQGPDTQSGGS